jgi:TP901 family phage tail tape measure protein
MSVQAEIASLFYRLGARVDGLARDLQQAERMTQTAVKRLSPTIAPRMNLTAIRTEMRQLEKGAADLRQRLLQAVPDSREARQLAASLEAVEARMRGLKAASDDTMRVWQQMGRVGAQLSLFVSLPLAAFYRGAIMSGREFEKNMRNVNSIAKLSETQFRATTEEVKGVGKELGKSPGDLADGLYDIASSGFQGAEGMKVLKASALGAKAGLATTKEAAASITTVLNAYGLSADQAAHVNDVMFKTVEAGVVTYSQLGSSLGQVISTAATAGVSFEEVGAAYATMTKAGIDAAETSTALNRVILAFLNPSQKLAEAMRQSGYESGTAVLHTLGLAGAVQYLSQVTGGSVDELAQLGLDVRALKAAMSLARDEGRVFAQDLDTMKNASGAAKAAFKEQSKSFNAQVESMSASIETMKIEMFEALLPVLKIGAAALKEMADGFTKMPEPIKAVVAVLGLLAIYLPPVLMGLSRLPLILLGLSIAKVKWLQIIAKLAPALASLAANPVALVIAALAALGLAVHGVVKHFQKKREEMDRLIRDNSKLGESYDELRERVRNLANEEERREMLHKEAVNGQKLQAAVDDEQQAIRYLQTGLAGDRGWAERKKLEWSGAAGSITERQGRLQQLQSALDASNARRGIIARTPLGNDPAQAAAQAQAEASRKDAEAAEKYNGFMTDYFNNVYGTQRALFFEKCLFVCDEKDRQIGTCFIWKAYGKINTIHWYKVLKEYEGQGIGRALLSAVMKDLRDDDFPVYLHTQPSSYRAIKLYSDFGFDLLSDSAVGSRRNDLSECLPILKSCMPPEEFIKLRITKAPAAFLEAINSSGTSQF